MRCRGCPHKALIPREDLWVCLSRERGGREGREREWMGGGEKNGEQHTKKVSKLVDKIDQFPLCVSSFSMFTIVHSGLTVDAKQS